MTYPTKLLISTIASVALLCACATTQAVADDTSATAKTSDNAPKEKQARKRGSHGGGHGKVNFFDSYDANNDESVSIAEYRAVRNEGYDVRDANKDGNVLADEYVAEYEARLEKDLAEMRDHQIKQAYVRFGVLDKDKNGVISREEFQASGKRMFDRLDTNKDGVVNESDTTKVY